MSYAGRSSRSTAAPPPSRPVRSSSSGTRAAPSRGRSRPEHADAHAAAEVDWQQVALFGAGLALGLAVGAGAALLTAPRSGAETRVVLAKAVGRRARGGALRTRDAWEDLGDELRSLRRMLRRRRAQRVSPVAADDDDPWAAGERRPARAR